ncbi:MAG: serine hydrolase, partial [Pseudomonadota bacterium]
MLRVSSLAILLGTIAFISASNAEAAQCGDRAPFKAHRINNAKIDTGRFLSKIMADTRAAEYMGFAVLLHDNRGRRLAFARRGWAASPCDSVFGNQAQAFTLNTEINIGSTTKAIATTPAVLHMIDHRQDLSLGTFIRDRLPTRWGAELHSRWRNVTIDMMLQHRGGFKRSGNNSPWSASNARARLATGDLPNPPAVGTRSYSNGSMGMFHFMMMAMGSATEW